MYSLPPDWLARLIAKFYKTMEVQTTKFSAKLNENGFVKFLDFLSWLESDLFPLLDTTPWYFSPWLLMIIYHKW